MKPLNQLFENTLVLEAKKLVVLDILSGSDADKIKKVLEKEEVKLSTMFQQMKLIVKIY